MNKKKSLLISFIILLFAGVILVLIFISEPTAQRESAARETAMLVNVTPVSRGDYRPVFVTTGTVRPESEIVLSSRVSGEIIQRFQSFNPGEIVTKGTELVKIDPADFNNTLQLRMSELHRAEANLSIEKGQQEVARQDYQLSDENLSEANEALVLRIPQLKTAQAEVTAARAAVEQARLDLERTSVKAPFNAQILSRQVDVGSQVSPGDELARLVGIETYWVEAMVPQSRIQWIAFPDDESGEGAEVRVRNRSAWDAEDYRTGRLTKMVGALNEQTRLVRVLVSVPDPLGVKSDLEKPLPLLIGAFVETGIVGKKLEDVVKLNRDFVRKGQTVWVMEDEKLDIRDVEILVTDAQHAYIREGLNDGDKVVTTNLATVVDDAPLRLEENRSN